MQRILAVLIFSVIGFLPLAQDAAAVSSTPELPACCRAHGKHKCAMGTLGKAAAGPVIYSLCDQYPTSTALTCTAVSTFVFPPSSAMSHENLAGYPRARADRDHVVAQSIKSSHRKRGPPTFLS